MQFVYILATSLFYVMIMFAAFLFVRRQFERNSGKYRAVVAIFILILLMIVQNTVILFDLSGVISLPYIMRATIMVVSFIVMPSINGIWYLYIIHSLFVTRVSLKHRYLVIGSLAVNMFFSLLSLIPGTSIYFVIGENSITFGNLFFVHVLIYVFFYLVTLVVALNYFKRVQLLQRYIYFFVFTLPILGLLGQFFFEHVPFLLLSNIFSFLIIAMAVQYTQATTDYLTGLANRRSLSSYLERRLISSGGKGGFTIIMLDLDNFKMINDTLGHAAGDEALRIVSRFLSMGNGGTQFVARYGGDEFVIVSEHVSIDKIDEKIDDMRNEFAAQTPEHFKKFDFGFSVGYILYDSNSNLNINEIFSEIDSRMFKDKRMRGGNI